MQQTTITAMAGGTLHDFGKIIQRAGGTTGTHSIIGYEYLRSLGINNKDILDSVRYHHGRELRNAEDVSIYAYITYIADNIASATDRRIAPDEYASGGWDQKAPLQSVFNLLKHESARHYYRPVTLDYANGANYPQTEVPQFDEFYYSKIKDRLTENLKCFELTNNYMNSLLELIEATMSYVPSSTSLQETADISLFDHLKLTAAIAVCILYFLEEEGEQDYRRLLFDQSEKFYDMDFAMIYSADISGIQDFIYTIHSTGALKSLRGRSFYLELFAENLIDEILDAIGLNRTNLLYSGGGHFYLLLPNTQNVKEKIADVMASTNNWLLENFRSSLYIADGYCVCSANKLQNNPVDSYRSIYKEISQEISEKKLHRYSAQDIIRLNNHHVDGRECRICKSIGSFGLYGANGDVDDEGDECDMCAALIDLSYSVSKQYNADAVNDDVFYVVSKDIANHSPIGTVKKRIQLSATQYAYTLSKNDLQTELHKANSIMRYYGKNVFYTGEKLSTKLWVGDYCKDKEIMKYAESAEGISRIGVLRMDIDDLGSAFTTGFSYQGGKYNTLSRTASFSRHLSLFFKRDINMLLHNSKRDISIIYSGGDDMFLLGGWDDIIDTAIEINDSFRRYTQGKLTISAGIGIYPAKFPLHIMARETGELENHAKGNRTESARHNNANTNNNTNTNIERTNNKQQKNAVTLFTPEFRFSWDELTGQVIGEKLAALKSFFIMDIEKGNAFLYKILAYILGVEEEEVNDRAKISLARYAYLLARAEPESEDADVKQKFKDFSKQMYTWISNSEDRRQLKAAIHIFVYSKRRKRGES